MGTGNALTVVRYIDWAHGQIVPAEGEANFIRSDRIDLSEESVVTSCLTYSAGYSTQAQWPLGGAVHAMAIAARVLTVNGWPLCVHLLIIPLLSYFYFH